MNPIIEQIKHLLLLPLSNSPNLFISTSSTSPISSTLSISSILSTSPTLPVTAFNIPEIYQEIENAADVFIMIEE
ncbi:14667_t:CDS:1, partial [Funneliformis geosporum]